MPDRARATLAAAIDTLRATVDGAKWVPPENLHVTVSFLGSVPDERAEEVARALADAVEGARRVPTRLTGLGAFPRASRARVIWAGLQDDEGELAALAARVHESLAQIGFGPEARAWQAHVTLARLRRPRAVLLDVDVPALEFDVDEVVLYQSRLQRPSPVYLPVASVVLA